MEDPHPDVELHLEDMQISAHKEVLSRSSEYFRSMLRGDFLEGNKDIVRIDGVAGEAMKSILYYMYTGSVNVERGNLETLLPAANLFSMSHLMMLLSLQAEELINEHTCLSIWALASLHNYPTLKDAAWTYTLENFSKIPVEEIVKLPLDILKMILKQSFLKETTSEYLENIAEIWMKSSGRDDLRGCLLELVRSRTECHKHRTKMLWVVGGTNTPKRNLKTAESMIIRPTDGRTQWKSRKPRYCVRGVPESEDCHVIPPMLTTRGRLTSTASENFIYLLGGEHLYQPTTACEEYNVKTNTWRVLPNLPEPLIGASAAFYNDKIYLCGDGSFFSLLTEAAKWHSLPSPPVHRRYHCLVPAPGFLYLIGGQDIEGNAKNNVYRYDVSERTWKEVAPMMEARERFGGVRIGSHIYVIGGVRNQYVTAKVERYDIIGNTWTQCSKMPGGRYDMAVTVCERQLYSMGGTNYNGEPLSYVERFNPINGLWHTHPSLQVGRSGAAATVFYVPEFDRAPL